MVVTFFFVFQDAERLKILNPGYTDYPPMTNSFNLDITRYFWVTYEKNLRQL